MSLHNIYARLLESAIVGEDEEALLRALKAGESPNRIARDGRPVLHMAIEKARHGGTGLVSQLLDAGADIDALAGDRTPLMTACMSGKKLVCALLAQRGAALDRVDGDGWSAMMWATAHASRYYGMECIDVLLKAGANANLVSKTGSDLLMLAAGKGMIDIMPQLIEATGDVCRRNSKGLRASGCALDGAHRQEHHRECADLLLHHEQFQDVAVDLEVDTPVVAAPSRVRRI